MLERERNLYGPGVRERILSAFVKCEFLQGMGKKKVKTVNWT